MLAFLAPARALHHAETSGFKPVTDLTGRGEGRETSTRAGQARDFSEQRRGPGLGVLGGGKAVEEPEVDLRLQPGERCAGLAVEQQQVRRRHRCHPARLGLGV